VYGVSVYIISSYFVVTQNAYLLWGLKTFMSLMFIQLVGNLGKELQKLSKLIFPNKKNTLHPFTSSK